MICQACKGVRVDCNVCVDTMLEARVETQLAIPLDTVETDVLQVYRMVLPFLPPSKNQFDAWPVQWKSGVKKKWKAAIAAKAAELQMPLDLTHVGLAAKLVFPSKQRRDPQNYAQCVWNWVPDALVQCGVLRDDRDGMVEIGPNWGISMAVDLRPGVPKQHRSRTLIAVSVLGVQAK